MCVCVCACAYDHTESGALNVALHPCGQTVFGKVLALSEKFGSEDVEKMLSSFILDHLFQDKMSSGENSINGN